MYAGRPERMKQVNEALVREALAARGKATKAQLGADTGLSLPTISQATAALTERGEIRAAGMMRSSGGRKATEYELDEAAGTVYAIALERDRIDWAMANALGTVVSTGGRLVRSNPVSEAVELVGAMRRDAVIRSSERVVLAIGVPGAVQDGRVITGHFEEQWYDTDIAEFFRKRTGLPVVVENDINASALGYERRLDSIGQCPHSLVYVYVSGTCTGSGIVVGGQVVRGAAHFAGELDYLPVARGQTLRDALAGAVGDESIVDALASALAAVNCVVNPALFVVGGPGFRFDLSDAVEAEFKARVPVSVRPRLAFERDTMPHYLNGLCGLALDRMFSSFRLVSGGT
ncbi:MAG TPA: ROK family protein [Spirochaetales bacterium]|nr:ROK family protein [Spirochaetales bacterium]HPG87232.1 ROK family protein [Spirochaetales bacterium]